MKSVFVFFILLSYCIPAQSPASDADSTSGDNLYGKSKFSLSASSAFKNDYVFTFAFSPGFKSFSTHRYYLLFGAGNGQGTVQKEYNYPDPGFRKERKVLNTAHLGIGAGINIISVAVMYEITYVRETAYLSMEVIGIPMSFTITSNKYLDGIRGEVTLRLNRLLVTGGYSKHYQFYLGLGFEI